MLISELVDRQALEFLESGCVRKDKHRAPRPANQLGDCLSTEDSSPKTAAVRSRYDQVCLEIFGACELQSEVGKEASIASLRFAPGRLPAGDATPADEALAAGPAVAPETLAEAERLTSQIGDETLRNLVARAAAASLQKARTDRPV